MSTEYVESGRAQQKSRTRAALIEAARGLVASGGAAPTVAETAAAAGISRTTAYRYFSSQDDLLEAAHPEVSATSMLGGAAIDDPEERLEVAVRGFLAMICDTEVQQRTMLRISLEARAGGRPLPLRQGRAIGWFSEALEPVTDQVGAEGVRRLAIAVRAVAGIEPLVWLTDMAGMSRYDAVEQMVWSALAVYRRFLDEDSRTTG
jgi:AcrR family transcriptional regulator